MNRREKFEQAYASAHDLPVETLEQYRMRDTYRLPMIAKCWRFWNLALDSIEGDVRQMKTIGSSLKQCLYCGEPAGHGGLACPNSMPQCDSLPGVLPGQYQNKKEIE